MTLTRACLAAVVATVSLVAVGCTASLGPRALPVPRASELPQIRAGQRVRVTASGSGMTKEIVNIAALSADSITLTAGRDTVTLPLYAVQKLELSRGRSGSRFSAGLGIGAGVGAFFGVLVALEGAKNCIGDFCGLWIAVPPVGAIVGATVGGIYGAFSHPEIWEPVPLESLRRLRIGIVPQPRGGLGLGVSLVF